MSTQIIISKLKLVSIKRNVFNMLMICHDIFKKLYVMDINSRKKKRHRYYLPGTNMMNKSEINIKFWWKYLKSGKSTQREYDANLLLFFSIIGGTGDIWYTYSYEKMLTFQNSMQIHLDLRQCFTIGLWWISHWESKFRIQN